MFKLYKQERKLKEMPGRKPGNEHLPIYVTEIDIEPDDWKDWDEEKLLSESDFVLQHQDCVRTPWEDCTETAYNHLTDNVRRIIARPAKPSAKESQGEEKNHEVAGAEFTDKLKTIIFVGGGYISMCWNPLPTGIFDSTEAEKKGNEMADSIINLFKDWHNKLSSKSEEGDQEKFIAALKKDITDLYEEQFKDRQEIERLKEELNTMTRLYNELNHLTSGY